MKRIITTAFVIALSIGAVHAQDSTRHAKNHREHKMNGPAHELNLSAEQKAKMKDLHQKERQEMEAIRNNKSLTAEQQKAQRTELQKKYRAEMSAILTPAQKEQMEKMHDERKQVGKEAKRDFKKGDAARGDAFKRGGREGLEKELDLTPAQQEQMKQIRADFKGKFEALRANTSLTQEQKKEQSKTLMQQQQDKIRSILTPEQIEKMKTARKNKGARNTK